MAQSRTGLLESQEFESTQEDRLSRTAGSVEVVTPLPPQDPPHPTEEQKLSRP
jgi:hypothetical protein